MNSLETYWHHFRIKWHHIFSERNHRYSLSLSLSLSIYLSIYLFISLPFSLFYSESSSFCRQFNDIAKRYLFRDVNLKKNKMKKDLMHILHFSCILWKRNRKTLLLEKKCFDLCKNMVIVVKVKHKIWIFLHQVSFLAPSGHLI